MDPALRDVPLEFVTPEQRDAMIDGFARMVVKRRLETPAIFLLEAHRPLAFMASQGVCFSAPLLGAFFGFRRMNQWSRILEDRENWDRVIARIEQAAAERDRGASPVQKKGTA